MLFTVKDYKYGEVGGQQDGSQVYSYRKRGRKASAVAIQKAEGATISQYPNILKVGGGARNV